MSEPVPPVNTQFFLFKKLLRDFIDIVSTASQSEDLLWNDYEEKLNDQVVRTMENYTSQFPEVKVNSVFFLFVYEKTELIVLVKQVMHFFQLESDVDFF